MTFSIAPTVYADDEVKEWFYSPSITNFDSVAKDWLINACDTNTINYNVFVYRVKEPYITLWFEAKATYIPYPIMFYDVRIYEYVPTIWNALEMYRDNTIQEATQAIEELSIKYGLSYLPCIPNWQCEVDLDGKNTGYKIDINGCFESTYDDVMCPPGEEPPEEPNILFYVIVGGLGLIGLKLISKK